MKNQLMKFIDLYFEKNIEKIRDMFSSESPEKFEQVLINDINKKIKRRDFKIDSLIDFDNREEIDYYSKTIVKYTKDYKKTVGSISDLERSLEAIRTITGNSEQQLLEEEYVFRIEEEEVYLSIIQENHLNAFISMKKEEIKRVAYFNIAFS